MTMPDDTIRVLIPLKVRKKNGRPKILPPQRGSDPRSARSSPSRNGMTVAATHGCR